MNRNVGTKILSLLFIVVFACFGIKATRYVPATENTKPETFSHQSHTPNSELEGLYFPTATGGHGAVQKNAIPLLYQVTASDFHSKPVLWANWQIKESSLLIKDYLSHIYPSHNFW
jgi:hypothetical protein